MVKKKAINIKPGVWAGLPDSLFKENYQQFGSDVHLWKLDNNDQKTLLKYKTKAAVRGKAKRLGVKYKGSIDESEEKTDIPIRRSIRSKYFVNARALNVFRRYARDIDDSLLMDHLLLKINAGKAIVIHEDIQDKLKARYGPGKDFKVLALSDANMTQPLFAIVRGTDVTTLVTKEKAENDFLVSPSSVRSMRSGLSIENQKTIKEAPTEPTEKSNITGPKKTVVLLMPGNQEIVMQNVLKVTVQ